MGNAASGEEGRHRLGYHVLRVKEGSPADRAGIRPFFDYIVGINGIRLNKEDQELHSQMMANQEKTITLDIYSTREQAGRRVEMVPTTQWGDGKGGLLGCSICFCMFDAANDNVWHVLDVYQGSPAERAGLCAHSDYIIGTPYGMMRGEGDLYDLVEDNAGEPLRLYVYNSEMDHVREVIIVPNYDWGGEGLLGCDVGYGYLHRLPRGPVSAAQGGVNATLKRSPSLPYPGTSSSSHTNESGYARNTMPANLNNHPAAAATSDNILAPTPRPTQPPMWLDPEQQEKLSNMTTPRNTVDFYQEGDDQGGQGSDEKGQSGEIESGHPPLLRFGKGNRPDAEDESDEEDFVPRHGPASHETTQPLPAAAAVSQGQLQQQNQPSSELAPVATTQPDLATGFAGLAIQGVPAVSENAAMHTSPSSATAPTGSNVPTQTPGHGNTPVSSPPSGIHHSQHHHQHAHHTPPQPVMTRFQARHDPGTTPPPSAAALESPFPQALAQPSHPAPSNSEGKNTENHQDKKQTPAKSPPMQQQQDHHHHHGAGHDDEINFGDIPFGAGEVPNFASLMNRPAPSLSEKAPAALSSSSSPPLSRGQQQQQRLAMGARTMHQMEPPGRVSAHVAVAQAQNQSEEYRRAMEQYSR